MDEIFPYFWDEFNLCLRNFGGLCHCFWPNSCCGNQWKHCVFRLALLASFSSRFRKRQRGFGVCGKFRITLLVFLVDSVSEEDILEGVKYSPQRREENLKFLRLLVLAVTYLNFSCVFLFLRLFKPSPFTKIKKNIIFVNKITF